MKSERSNALKPGELDLSCKATKYSGAGTGDLRVLIIQETSPCLGGACLAKLELLLSHSIGNHGVLSRVPLHGIRFIYLAEGSELL